MQVFETTRTEYILCQVRNLAFSFAYILTIHFISTYILPIYLTNIVVN